MNAWRAHPRILRRPFAAHACLVGERGGAGHPAAGRIDRRHLCSKNKAPSRGNYQTASLSRPASGEGSYALIRFQPQANAADISKFLETNKLTIADGPSPGGLYRVRVSPSKVSDTDLAGIVKKLQDNSVVGFIAPTE